MNEAHKELAKILQEDVKKFGKVENGNLVLDDGFEKQIVGKINKNENIVDLDQFFNITYHKQTGIELCRSVDIHKVADYLIRKYHFATWFGVKSDYSFVYDGKIFKPETRGLIKFECERLLKEYCRKNIVEEIFEKVKRSSKVNKEEFEKTDTNLIPLENGIWDIKNKELLPHNSKYNFQFIIPQIYNVSAKCPTWMKFINETLYEEDIPVLQEWFGFFLFREYFIKKAVICEGPQDTGKSVLLDTAIEFLGEKNKTGLSLQKISSGSDFTKLSLKNKHGNIYDDLSSNDLNDGGAFKVATGGGYISAEEKFGEYQQFKNFAKQIFATNKIPPVKDNDDLAYFGRWIVFKFDNVPEKLNPFLRKELFKKEEMSGILNWALFGLYRLLENCKFSYNKSSEDIKMIMERSGCPLVEFSSEVLIKDNSNFIENDEMYKVYSLWCEKTKRPRLTKSKLKQQLPKYCNYILDGKRTNRGWLNARIDESWSKLIEKQVKLDTKDTFSNIICVRDKGIGNISLKKASYPSKVNFTDEQIKDLGYSPEEIIEIQKLNKSEVQNGTKKIS